MFRIVPDDAEFCPERPLCGVSMGKPGIGTASLLQTRLRIKSPTGSSHREEGRSSQIPVGDLKKWFIVYVIVPPSVFFQCDNFTLTPFPVFVNISFTKRSG